MSFASPKVKTNTEYAKSQFLIYSSWTRKLASGGSVSGSLLLDGANSEEEAVALIELYKGRRLEFDRKFSSGGNQENHYVAIPNRAEWWSNTR